MSDLPVSLSHSGDTTNSIHYCLQLLRDVSAKPPMNERARKETFISYLRSIFPEPEYQSRITALAGGAEFYMSTRPSSLSSSTRGFADTHNGQLVIEFKADLTDRSDRDTAEIELKRYIASLWTSHGPESSFCCIATDILHWIVWRPVPSMTPADGSYTAEMVVLEGVDKLDIDIPPSESNAQHLFLLFKRTLIDANLLPLTAENLRRDFGPESALYRLSLPTISNIISRARSNVEIKLAIELWGKYQEYNARTSKHFNIELYSKQLYLVILSRLMVATYFRDRTDTTIDDAAIREILTGTFFSSRVRLNNFVESDFFGWTTTDPWIYDLLPLARQIYHELRSYDFSNSKAENVFRLIYDEMLPAEQQELFGQRSTPEALVSSIIRFLLKDHKSGYRYLDPACGSGSFLRVVLLETLERLRVENLSAQEQLSQLKKAVTGIDIDPIAIILSKALWALTLADLLPYSAELVDIPIYHADSLFVVNDSMPIVVGKGKKTIFDTPRIVFDDNNTSIEISAELFNDIPAFDKFVNRCYSRAKALSETARVSDDPHMKIQTARIDVKLPALLGRTYSTELREQADALVISAERLARELALRIFDRRNGIWAFILRNSYRPSLFAGCFDIIASNPPWLAMSSLPNIPYKEQLQQLADRFNIRPTGSSFLHTEIATTFVLYNVFHFLHEGGSAAFIMPRTLFDGNHHHPFRLFQFAGIVPFSLKEIWDLGDVDGLFKIPCCVIFGTKNAKELKPPEEPIRARLWSSLEDSFDMLPVGSIQLDHLGKTTAWVAKTSTSSTEAKYDYYTNQFRQGADLMPRTALFVELINDNPAQNVVAVRTSTVEQNNKDNKVLKGHRFQGSASRRYLFSTVTSNLLLPFVVLNKQLPTILLPIELGEEGIQILSNDDLIDRGNLEAAQWFTTVDRALIEWSIATHQRGSVKPIHVRIDERKKLTQQHYTSAQLFVLYGAGGSSPCASVFIPDQSTERPFIADQTTYVCPMESEDEAYYVVGILNAPILADIIKPFQAKGDFGARHVHQKPLSLIPPFDSEDPTHQHIVVLSRNATDAAGKVLTKEMHDETGSLARRRRLLSAALSREIENLNEAVKKVFHI